MPLRALTFMAKVVRVTTQSNVEGDPSILFPSFSRFKAVSNLLSSLLHFDNNSLTWSNKSPNPGKWRLEIVTLNSVSKTSRSSDN